MARVRSRAGKRTRQRRVSLAEVQERLQHLLEKLIAKVAPALKNLECKGSPKAMHQPLARLEVDGYVYVLSRAPARPHRRLSPRERQIATLASAGLRNKAIARQLEITSATVATHLQRIYKKLGVETRAALAHETLLLS